VRECREHRHARCKWDKLDIIKGKRKREKGSRFTKFGITLNIRALLKSQFVLSLNETRSQTGKRFVSHESTRGRNGNSFFFLVFFSFETTENICRKNTVIIMIIIRTYREYRFLLGMRYSSLNNLLTTTLSGSINIRLKIRPIFWYSPI